MFPLVVEHWMKIGSFGIPFSIKLRMPTIKVQESDGDGEAPSSKGEQPRSQDKVPKSMLSVKGGDNSYTTRMLA